MCVRCGTGRVAWCTSPDGHAGDRQAVIEAAMASLIAHHVGEYLYRHAGEDECPPVANWSCDGSTAWLDLDGGGRLAITVTLEA